MANINKFIPFLLRWEGSGFTNDPVDFGGATMKGITFRTFKEYRKKVGKPEPTIDDLKNISDAEWLDVVRVMFWNLWKADLIISQPVANFLVDWFFNSGSYGIKRPQRLLKVKDDGDVGKETIDAVNEMEPFNLFTSLHNDRIAFINEIVKYSVDKYLLKHPGADERELKANTQLRFKQGWLNRINDLKYINF